MKVYADTNYFTRFYLDAVSSDERGEILAAARDAGAEPLPVSWLLRAEFANALQLHIFVARQPGNRHVTAQQAATALATFREDYASEDFLVPARLEPEALIDTAEDLSIRHTARHGFRTYDVLHVASALLLECDTFWSFDERAVRLAHLEGLKTPTRKRR